MIPPAVRSRLRRPILRTRAGRRLWWRTHGIAQELGFWSAWFEQRGAHWSDDFERRVQAEPEIDDPLVIAELERLGRPQVRILDVGAGPISRLGVRFGSASIDLVPVDPLADEYADLLRAHGIEPAVRTIKAHGERLLEHFPPKSFDLTYAVNSVDHSYDPVRIVANMFELVRPDGAVLLRHERNEGEHRRYSGLHQWNFDVDGRDAVVWNHAVRQSLGDLFADRGTVDAWIEGPYVLVRIAPTEAGVT